MLAMARALMGQPTLLLLDEPSMGLAPLLVEETFRVVKHLRSEALRFSWSSKMPTLRFHRRHWIRDGDGHTILTGTGESLLNNEQVKQAYLGM